MLSQHPCASVHAFKKCGVLIVQICHPLEINIFDKKLLTPFTQISQSLSISTWTKNMKNMYYVIELDTLHCYLTKY